MALSDSSSQDLSITGIELGYLTNIECEETWKLHRCYFPSKLGGKPAWLDPKNLPSSDDLKCKSCGKPTIFLMQIYAPNETVDRAFHRTIFIFCCTKPECYVTNSSNAFHVFRCQLSRENDFYSSEPPDYESETYSKSCKEFGRYCTVCGCKGDKFCSKCKTVAYCGKDHQVLDWKSHKSKCGNSEAMISNDEDNILSKILFPEDEIVIEEEELNNDSNIDETNGVKNLESGSENVPGDRSFSPRELEQFANCSVEDNQFTNFRKAISNSSDQILRYDKGGEPLWCSNENQVLIENVPKCTSCGLERQFEFQVMPQLLNHLGIESSLDSPSVDWGILAIYTCSDDCVSNTVSYIPEYLHKQDFSHSESGL